MNSETALMIAVVSLSVAVWFLLSFCVWVRLRDRETRIDDLRCEVSSLRKTRDGLCDKNRVLEAERDCAVAELAAARAKLHRLADVFDTEVSKVD